MLLNTRQKNSCSLKSPGYYCWILFIAWRFPTLKSVVIWLQEKTLQIPSSLSYFKGTTGIVSEGGFALKDFFFFASLHTEWLRHIWSCISYCSLCQSISFFYLNPHTKTPSCIPQEINPWKSEGRLPHCGLCSAAVETNSFHVHFPAAALINGRLINNVQTKISEQP